MQAERNRLRLNMGETPIGLLTTTQSRFKKVFQKIILKSFFSIYVDNFKEGRLAVKFNLSKQN